MRNAWEKGLMMVMVLALAVAPTVSYGAPAKAKTEELKVCAGKLEGTVVDSRGNVQADVAVRILRDGKLFTEVRTDTKGRYVVANLPEGKADIIVASQPALNVVASKTAKVCKLQLVTPLRSDYASADLTGTQWVWIVVGVVVVIAVATPIIINNTDDSSTGGSGVTETPPA